MTEEEDFTKHLIQSTITFKNDNTVSTYIWDDDSKEYDTLTGTYEIRDNNIIMTEDKDDDVSVVYFELQGNTLKIKFESFTQSNDVKTYYRIETILSRK